MSDGKKDDAGKLKWHAMPKVILIPLVMVFMAALKYGLYNCLKDFKDCDARFADALDRHLVACQMDPLAKDPEDGCYHSAKVAWYALMRIYHAERAHTHNLPNCGTCPKRRFCLVACTEVSERLNQIDAELKKKEHWQ